MASSLLSGQALPPGYAPLSKTIPILEKTREIRLAPDLSELSSGEREAVEKLLEAGKIIQKLYEDQLHDEALAARASLEALHQVRPGRATENLMRLYYLNDGPIVTTLENEREAMLPVSPVRPGKNVYPAGVTREEIEAFLSRNPEERDSILAVRTVVRRADPSSLARDLGMLNRYAALDVLHPGLRSKLNRLAAAQDAAAFYAVPYSVAWAEEVMKVYALVNDAAEAVRSSDPEFAGYLENRARDLLSDDYESGDASWVTGRFDDLNAQIGSYEVYDDELFGVKSFWSSSILLRDRAESESLRAAIAGLQEFEDSLPYESDKKVREDIPVAVYDVIADFGQARGTNTATILPNEEEHARKYGRTILLRSNIMRHSDLFSGSSSAWKAAVAEPFEDDLANEGNFYRTLWHEIGHYLGVDRTASGRSLDEALGASSSTLEEMKADLVSLFLARRLHERGYYDDARLRSVYASGIRRVLQNNRPRRDQPYQTMQLMQWNWFMDRGVLTFDPKSKELSIDSSKYHQAVASLLREVLALQRAGDPAAADAFIDRWTRWDESIHGAIAAKMRDAQTHRFTIVRYAALEP